MSCALFYRTRDAGMDMLQLAKHLQNRHMPAQAHTSCLTPHNPHLTPHDSHPTPHTSHLTPHSRLLTLHTSNLTPRTSPREGSGRTQGGTRKVPGRSQGRPRENPGPEDAQERTREGPEKRETRGGGGATGGWAPGPSRPNNTIHLTNNCCCHLLF